MIRCSFCNSYAFLIANDVPDFGDIFKCEKCHFTIFRDKNGKITYTTERQKRQIEKCLAGMLENVIVS